MGEYLTVAHIADYTDKLLEISEREQVYHLKQTIDGYRSGHTLSYGKFLRKLAMSINNGRFNFFEGWAKLHDLTIPDLVALSLVSYYDEEDNIIENKVNNLGKLLHTLRIRESEDRIKYGHGREPLSIQGEPIEIRNKEMVEDIRISFILYTDIWLPWVIGSFDDLKLDKETGHRILYDNRELANRHTPRLNRFLAEARELTLSMGGTWELEQVNTPNPMVTETGINLDWDYEAEKKKENSS